MISSGESCDCEYECENALGAISSLILIAVLFRHTVQVFERTDFRSNGGREIMEERMRGGEEERRIGVDET
jgi:hypothetical protein